MTTAMTHLSETESVKDIKSAYSPYQIGYCFARVYYETMAKKPEDLKYFYKKDSFFLCGGEEEKEESLGNLEDIGNKIKEMGFDECKIHVTQIDCQRSINDSVLVRTLGEICLKDKHPQRFSQTFFLAPQVPDGYYILNDIFRFLKDENADVDEKVPKDIKGKKGKAEEVQNEKSQRPKVNGIVPKKTETPQTNGVNTTSRGNEKATTKTPKGETKARETTRTTTEAVVVVANGDMPNKTKPKLKESKEETRVFVDFKAATTDTKDRPTKDALREHFQTFGDVVNVVMFRNGAAIKFADVTGCVGALVQKKTKVGNVEVKVKEYNDKRHQQKHNGVRKERPGKKSRGENEKSEHQVQQQLAEKA